MRRKLTPVSMRQVTLTSGILKERQQINARVTVPLIYRRCVETGRVSSLLCGWKEGDANRPHPFWDSDIGKVIEAISYSLITDPNEELERKVDEMVDLLEREQCEDGYLNTYYRTFGLEERWTNLYYMHELYCAGHLMEGAVAYVQATGKRKFLDIMCRYADCIYHHFIEEPKADRGYCGHPEIELALVRLYGETKQERYLELSKYFIDQRGQQPYYFERESLARGVDTTKTANQKRHLKYYLRSRGPYAEYQAHKPVSEQTEPVGHAVRAMYLYSGMADIAAAFDDEELYRACDGLWDALSKTQFYITGGIGPSSEGERFTFAYDLPNEYTYNETCASVALIMWAHRMFHFQGESRFIDLLEQTLYNTALGSVSLEGDKFFYANYLSVYPERFEHASAALIDKMRAQRQEWFDVSCCPPNISRLIGSIGGYAYSVDEEGVYVNLYTGSTVACEVKKQDICLTVSTKYPWEETVGIRVECKNACAFIMNLRIPGWCSRWTVKVNGDHAVYIMHHGYCTMEREWRMGDEIELFLEMPIMQIEANPAVRENCGRIALQRGPVVYCLEQADNGPQIQDLSIPEDCRYEVIHGGVEGLPADVRVLSFDGYRREQEGWNGELYRNTVSSKLPVHLLAVPYWVWGNRGFGEMNVWIRK